MTYHICFLYIKHRVLESSARIKENRKRKTNKQKNEKTIQRQSCAAQRIPPFTLLLDNILYIYIYTVCVYFCHSYKNKIRYCRCATIHTKVKTKHRKAVQSSLRAKIHTIVKKKVKERKERKGFVSPFKKNKYMTFELYHYSPQSILSVKVVLPLKKTT